MTATTKKFRPILFSTDMVQALLSGKKTQTRRIIKDVLLQENKKKYDKDFLIATTKSKYNVGDVLWVRETFNQTNPVNAIYYYKASTHEDWGLKWKPSIFMPKAACRIFLEITDVRIERLQDITEADAIAEGVNYDKQFQSYDCYLCPDTGHYGTTYFCEDGFVKTAYDSFRSLWIDINYYNSWITNPFIWAITFKRIDKPENFTL